MFVQYIAQGFKKVAVLLAIPLDQIETKNPILFYDFDNGLLLNQIDLAVGDGDKDENGKRIAMDVKTGDQVLFPKYSGTEIKIDGKKLLNMREADILAILTK